MRFDRYENAELSPATKDYLLAASYDFARPFTENKTVADIRTRGSGHGASIIFEGADQLTTLTSLSSENLAQNENRFDVVTAFGSIEGFNEHKLLVAAAKNLLKEDGVFIVAAADKQTFVNERNRRGYSDGVYVPEFKEMLEQNFQNVNMYRLGIVAGAAILPEERELGSVPVKSANFYSEEPVFGREAPRTWFVLAICDDGRTNEVYDKAEKASMLLDGSAVAFDEYEEMREKAWLFQEEIEHMRRTEILAFRDAIRIAASDRILTEVARRLGVASRIYRPAIRFALSVFTLMSKTWRRLKRILLRGRASNDE